METFSFDIDVAGACNLRCPCCPQGNMREYRLPQGFMEPELLARIIGKAAAECRIADISLFNWTEPLLHPRLPELVRIVQDAGIPCHLSSNLNLLPDADAVMAANPASFKISTSGFTQANYGYTHRGGDIERVKRHMVELAEAKKRSGAATRIFVSYHRYRNNLREEPLMRDFASSLGFDFEPAWALFFPIEKLLGDADHNPESPESLMSSEDFLLIDRLAFPLRETLETARRYGGRPCSLMETRISTDFRGDVQLCCGVFNSGKFTLGSFLDLPLEQIQRLRRSHGTCEHCIRQGAHLFLNYQIPEMEELILESISPEDADLLDLSREMARKRFQRRLQGMYPKFLRQIVGSEQKAVLQAKCLGLLGLAGRARRRFSGKK